MTQAAALPSQTFYQTSLSTSGSAATPQASSSPQGTQSSSPLADQISLTRESGSAALASQYPVLTYEQANGNDALATVTSGGNSTKKILAVTLAVNAGLLAGFILTSLLELKKSWSHSATGIAGTPDYFRTQHKLISDTRIGLAQKKQASSAFSGSAARELKPLAIPTNEDGVRELRKTLFGLLHGTASKSDDEIKKHSWKSESSKRLGEVLAKARLDVAEAESRGEELPELKNIVQIMTRQRCNAFELAARDASEAEIRAGILNGKLLNAKGLAGHEVAEMHRIFFR